MHHLGDRDNRRFETCAGLKPAAMGGPRQANSVNPIAKLHFLLLSKSSKDPFWHSWRALSNMVAEDCTDLY